MVGDSAKTLRKSTTALRLLWCSIGISAGIALALFMVEATSSKLFLASLGGTAVFLFGLTRAPAAQPRALFGGHIGSALVGIACFQIFGDALWVYALAQVLALSLMLLTKTVHPPAGANPIIMIHFHSSLSAIWNPVLVGIICLTSIAAVWSRLLKGHVRYPVSWFERSPQNTFWGGWDD